MTIDEAIEKHRGIAGEKRVLSRKFEAVDNINMCLECAKEHEQLAEWLKDYKRLKSVPEHTYENCHNLTCRRKSEKEAYNKAIDDFKAEIKKLIVDLNVIRFKNIDEIAEQLKAGGKNE